MPWVLLPATAVAAWALVLVVRGLATRHGLLDVPNERSLHREPTPTAGGLGPIGVVVAAVVVAWGSGALALDAAGPVTAFALAMAALGLGDDLLDLGPAPRLAVQLGLAVAFVAHGGAFTGLGLPWGWAAPVITVGWLVVVVNFVNFMDGMDGLAAAMAVVGAAAMGLAGLGAGATDLALLAGLVAAGSAGLLLHNAPPARIFMGNAGSGWLGGFFAAYAVACERAAGIPAGFFAVVLAPALLDAGGTLVCRVLRGERWYVAHRGHLYQRLVLAGWSQRKVLAVEGGLMLACAGLSALAYRGRLVAAALGAVLAVGALAAVVVAVERRARRVMVHGGGTS